MGNFNVGDKVRVECWRGFGTGGEDVVTALDVRYDEKTGEAIPIVRVGDSWYNDSNGDSYKQEKMYYIYKLS